MSVVATTRRQQFRAVGSAAGAKILLMGASGLIGILTTRLIISSFGTEAYAQYGLLTSLRDLLPFADLGVAAAAISVIASSRNPSEDDVVRRTLLSAFRIIFLSTAAICLVAAVLTVGGLWRPLLGNAMSEQAQVPAT